MVAASSARSSPPSPAARGVTILALGGLVLPALINDKYPEGFSLGLVTAAGSARAALSA